MPHRWNPTDIVKLSKYDGLNTLSYLIIYELKPYYQVPFHFNKEDS